MYWRLETNDATLLSPLKAPGALLAPPLSEGAGPSIFRGPHGRFGLAQEDLMAKGQKRSNRELKKPKQKKEPAPPAGMTKGVPASIGNPKRKR